MKNWKFLQDYSFFLFLILICSGCGYHFFQEGLPDSFQTISIPYVEGDKTGELTAAVVHAISSSGYFDYRPCGGSLILKIKIIDYRDENIGFRYDQTQQGFLTNTLIPDESRLCVLAELIVIEAATGRVIVGPARISANADFDHDYYFSQEGVNVFSLGQYTDVDAARDAVAHPLNRSLAQKIVDFISNAW